MGFLLYFINKVKYIDFFFHVKTILHSWDENQDNILFIYCWIQLLIFCFGFVTYTFTRDTGLYFLFLKYV